MSIFERIFGPSKATIQQEKEEAARVAEEAIKQAKDDAKAELIEQQRVEAERIAEEAEEKKEAERIAEEAEETRLAEIRSAAENIIEEKMESDEPWVEMVGASVDPEKGIRVELNWNPAFIKYLREGGVQGASEEECAQRWLAMISKDIDGKFADDDDDGKENSLYQ